MLFDSWRRGSIVSGGGEIKFNDSGAVFEAFGAYSQALPYVTDGFLHVHAGVEVPTDNTAPNELFWRAAVGKSFMDAPLGPRMVADVRAARGTRD